MVNGETGKVSGNRPYSIIKITLAVTVAVATIITALTLLHQGGYIDLYDLVYISENISLGFIFEIIGSIMDN